MLSDMERMTMTDDTAVGAGNSATAAITEPTTAQPTAPETTPVPQDPPAVPEIDLSKVADPDMQDFYRAQAELGAVKLAGQDIPPKTESKDGDEPPIKTEAQPAEERSDKPPMIPKPRLDEALTAKQRAEQEAAYWRGVAQARGEAMPEAASPKEQPKEPAIDDKLAALAAEEDALAKKYDEGEITLADFTRLSRDLRGREAAVREETLRAKFPQHGQPNAESTVEEVKRQLEAERQAQSLYEQHPAAQMVFPVQPEADLKVRSLMDTRRAMVQAEAKAALLNDHPGISGAQADALYREYLARTADRYAKVWFPEAAAAKVGSSSSPQAGGSGPMSPAAQDRLAKMEVQRQHPPNIGNLGTAKGIGDEWTPEKIASLSDDQFAALPDHVRARFR
jgi:hypothetical protein